ncbi:hypothetical protein PRIPAC_79571 [Pristionchus pacificus]|uniref:C6 domain-containing protein n=1 Tax=Pristionchus pacificus TaxID=54126 RepID=A0A2A6CPR8_PRIPA|nr:hypothetical protein PRIPAC_79571 [Pristionchus pacificus]|eukprot:PDM80098.1 hypothetical protein PRIPAC_32677 [Pristionchus pacificus]
MQLALLLLASVTTLTLACIPTKTPSSGIPVPACKKCAKSLIAIDTTTAGTKPFDAEPTLDTSGACSKITYLCTGKWVAINTDEETIFDSPTFTAVSFTCNDGGVWQDVDDSVTPPIITIINTIGCVM